jgi:hypothetical protein
MDVQYITGATSTSNCTIGEPHATGVLTIGARSPDVLGINPLKKGTVPFFADVDVWRGTAEPRVVFPRAPVMRSS